MSDTEAAARDAVMEWLQAYTRVQELARIEQVDGGEAWRAAVAAETAARVEMERTKAAWVADLAARGITPDVLIVPPDLQATARAVMVYFGVSGEASDATGL